MAEWSRCLAMVEARDKTCHTPLEPKYFFTDRLPIRDEIEIRGHLGHDSSLSMFPEIELCLTGCIWCPITCLLA